MTEVMKLIKVKLLCRKKSDKGHRIQTNNATTSAIAVQEILVKNPSECAIIKLSENSV